MLLAAIAIRTNAALRTPPSILVYAFPFERSVSCKTKAPFSFFLSFLFLSKVCTRGTRKIERELDKRDEHTETKSAAFFFLSFLFFSVFLFFSSSSSFLCSLFFFFLLVAHKKKNLHVIDASAPKVHFDYKYIRDHVSELQRNIESRKAKADAQHVAQLYTAWVEASQRTAQLNQRRNGIAQAVVAATVTPEERTRLLADGRALKEEISKADAVAQAMLSQLEVFFLLWVMYGCVYVGGSFVRFFSRRFRRARFDGLEPTNVSLIYE